jgi:hypothetical protein
LAWGRKIAARLTVSTFHRWHTKPLECLITVTLDCYYLSFEKVVLLTASSRHLFLVFLIKKRVTYKKWRSNVPAAIVVDSGQQFSRSNLQRSFIPKKYYLLTKKGIIRRLISEIGRSVPATPSKLAILVFIKE